MGNDWMEWSHIECTCVRNPIGVVSCRRSHKDIECGAPGCKSVSTFGNTHGKDSNHKHGTSNQNHWAWGSCDLLQNRYETINLSRDVCCSLVCARTDWREGHHLAHHSMSHASGGHLWSRGPWSRCCRQLGGRILSLLRIYPHSVSACLARHLSHLSKGDETWACHARPLDLQSMFLQTRAAATACRCR